MTTPVVIVHGLWLKGYEFFLLRNRLTDAGFAPSIFSYQSTHTTLAEATAALAARLRSFDGPVHVVAHSLGGVITFEMFQTQSELPEGRVVMLGAPLQGSRAARALARRPWGSYILGPLAIAELCGPCDRRWTSDRQIGLIAGSLGLGLGRMFAKLPPPHDGTICVDETHLPGASAHLVFDVSHTGMLVSARVVESTLKFLHSGTFGCQ